MNGTRSSARWLALPIAAMMLAPAAGALAQSPSPSKDPGRQGKGSPAEQAGMTLGDVVTTVDGEAVSTRDDFCAVMTGPQPVTIETAGGKTYDISVDEDFFTRP